MNRKISFEMSVQDAVERAFGGILLENDPEVVDRIEQEYRMSLEHIVREILTLLFSEDADLNNLINRKCFKNEKDGIFERITL